MENYIKQDISEAKKAQEALLLSNQRYNLVAKATHDTIWDFDFLNGDFFQNKTKIQDINSVEINQFLNQNFVWLNMIHPDDLDDFNAALLKACEVSLNQYWEHEYRLLAEDGKFNYVNSKGYIIRDENGTALRMIGATQDITDKVNYLKEIENQNKNLREIAWIQSHIVRAPLARIMGLINLINEENVVDEETKKLLNHILNSANEFDKIIKSIILNSQKVFN